jgi:hypothetical protein
MVAGRQCCLLLHRGSGPATGPGIARRRVGRCLRAGGSAYPSGGTSNMNRLSSAVRRLRGLIVLSAAAITVSVGVAAPAAADPDHSVSIRGWASCDAVAHEWVITWTLTNQSEVAGTIGNVRAYPPGRALVGMPNRAAPGETITGVQRTLRIHRVTGARRQLGRRAGHVQPPLADVHPQFLRSRLRRLPHRRLRQLSDEAGPITGPASLLLVQGELGRLTQGIAGDGRGVRHDPHNAI